MSNLSLIPAEDLLNELMRRFDDVVFKGRRKDDLKPTDHVAMYDWKGEHVICLGLCTEIQFDVLKHYNETKSDEEGLP